MQAGDSSIFAGTLTQLTASIAGTLFAISDGMSYGWTAPMIPFLISNSSHIATTQYEAEWLETDFMFGALCALPLTIYSVNKIGRKNSMLLAAVVSLLAWIMVATVNKMLYLHIARFIGGAAEDMAFVAAPMYIAEIADSKIRGFLSSIVYLMMLVGFVIVYSIGPYLPYYAIPLVGGIVLVTEIIIFSFMPESPHYLLFKNKPKLARKSLEYFRPDRDIEIELREISKSIDRQKGEKGGIREIFSVQSNRKALIIMTVLNFGQHMVAISVILMNMHIILQSAGSIYIDPSIAAIVFSIIMLLFAYISSMNIDKYGRRTLLLISTVSTSFCLLSLAVYFHLKIENYDVRGVSWLPIASVMVYAAAFKVGLGIVPMVITAEIFSVKVKALGMTISDAMYVVGALVSVQIYTWLEHSIGMHAPFYLFTASGFLVALFIFLYLPETKGKTLEEIQFLLKGEKYGPTKTDALLGEEKFLNVQMVPLSAPSKHVPLTRIS